MELAESLPLKKAFSINEFAGWEDNDLLIANIEHKNKGNMHLYNYGKNVLVDRDHPVLMKCRGLVVREDGVILNYPFDRFFNDFEKECKGVDFSTAEAQEKIDGSLICVFWNGLEWEITTRGSFYQSNHEADYANWFKEQFNSFEKLQEDLCYMFELVTRKNPIVTFYSDEFVVLLGARNLITLKEINPDILDSIAIELGVRRPKRYKVSDIESCKRLFSKLREDEEGLVVVDASFRRIKLKQESYCRLSKIKQLKSESLFNHLIGREEVDTEYLNKLPEVVAELNTMKETWDKYKIKVLDLFEKIKPLANNSRKDFALEAVKHKCKPFLFALLDNKKVEDVVNWNSVSYLFEKKNQYVKNYMRVRANLDNYKDVNGLVDRGKLRLDGIPPTQAHDIASTINKEIKARKRKKRKKNKAAPTSFATKVGSCY